MRLAGFNANRVGIEPMNGMGIYIAADTQGAPWDIAATIATPATVAVTWDLRQFAANATDFLWSLRHFVAETKALVWDVRQFAAQTVSVAWDNASGVIAFLAAKWRVPFSPHAGSSLARVGATSALARHTATSSISEH